MRQLQLRFDFDSTAVRPPFDCLSKVIKVTVTLSASRSLVVLFNYLGRRMVTARIAVEWESNGDRIAVELKLNRNRIEVQS